MRRRSYPASQETESTSQLKTTESDKEPAEWNYGTQSRESPSSHALIDSSNSSPAVSHLEHARPRVQATPKSYASCLSDQVSAKSSRSLASRLWIVVDEVSTGDQKESPNPSEIPSTTAVDPPRPAREGCEWVWFPEGYWAERERYSDKKSRSNRRTNKSTLGSNINETQIPPRSRHKLGISPPYEHAPPRHLHSSSMETADSNERNTGSDGGPPILSPSGKIRRGIQYISPFYPHFVSPKGNPEGLYCKAVRNIESLGGKGQKIFAFERKSFSAEFPPSRTTTTLQGASHHFDEVQKTQSDLSQATLPPSPSMNSKIYQKRIGLAPWHRGASQYDTWSVTSSIRDLIMGKTPLPTPNLETQYNVKDGQNYMKVEIPSPENPVFFPSETRGVHMPSVSGRVEGESGRGFFELSPPGGQNISGKTKGLRPSLSRVSSMNDSNPSNGPSKLQPPDQREWWDVDLPNAAKRKKTPASSFLMDLPEHFPNSPLCPMNEKHKSGGTGVCVYHGQVGKDIL